MSQRFQIPAGLAVRDKFVIGCGLLAVCGLAWTMMGWQASALMPVDASGAAATGMVEPPSVLIDFALIYLMWVVMMVAMMVPGASPMIAVFAAINRQRRQEGTPYVGTAVFLVGYLVAWSVFSVAATIVHLSLETTGLLTPMMASASTTLSAVLFAAAGLYQWTPLKDVCLRHCRTPIGFVLTEWRDGAAGAIVMGIRHGLYCIGCCVAIMGLLFAVAIMDLRWVATITVLVTLEKLLPRPRFWRHLIGAIFMGAACAFALGWAAAQGMHTGSSTSTASSATVACSAPQFEVALPSSPVNGKCGQGRSCSASGCA